MRIEIALGDITLQEADVVVSSSSPELAGQAGLEAAIRRHAGPDVLQECRQRRFAEFPMGAPPSAVIATSAGSLRANRLFHAHGPSYGSDSATVELAGCYLELLRMAEIHGARTLALPAISAGRRGFPVAEAATIAMRAVRYSHARVETIRFVLHNKTTYRAFVGAFISSI